MAGDPNSPFSFRIDAPFGGGHASELLFGTLVPLSKASCLDQSAQNIDHYAESVDCNGRANLDARRRLGRGMES
jgi:hypothetical protein